MTIKNTVKLAEKSREYLFPNGESVKFENIVELGFGTSGTHRLKTGDGKLHIVANGWLAITIDDENWTI